MSAVNALAGTRVDVACHKKTGNFAASVFILVLLVPRRRGNNDDSIGIRDTTGIAFAKRKNRATLSVAVVCLHGRDLVANWSNG